jgi:hypothetical protein
MLLAWIILIGGVGAIVAAVSFRRRSHDDEHSVEGYHRQLHTLEVVRAHASESGHGAEEGASYPEVAFRVSTHSTVRLTEPGKPAVPPVPPPPVADPDKPVTFDDAGPVISTPPTTPGSDWRDDRAMQGINKRPRRLAAPGAAVAVVMLVIIVLLVTGNHTVPPHKAKPPASSQHRAAGRGHHPAVTTGAHRSGTTTTTVVPIVSLPTAGSAHSAVYAVRPTSYTLNMSATTAQCWVSATEAGSGVVLFTGVLNPGQTQTVTATDAVSLVVGAPDVFAANIDGTGVSFPFGFQAPFTMQFLPAGQPQG